ncbi:hypothetical protein [Deinococcus roseus]|uniref:DUF485 domain-containing protein n=1 Tax=Deinococcus roseus TaxID=392414 RepID=A0ABQ2DFL6_9DEIO|nr:hypothetical protein [Deinococcus roseus]GGJ55597.1 hypothetical protein GCM10008938_47220 [Deinococcus roseus]
MPDPESTRRKRKPDLETRREDIRSRLIFMVIGFYFVVMFAFGVLFVMKIIPSAELATAAAVFITPLHGMAQFCLGYYYASNKSGE